MAFAMSEQKDFLKPSPDDQMREPTHTFGTIVPAMYNGEHLSVMFCLFIIATDSGANSEILRSSAWIHCTEI